MKVVRCLAGYNLFKRDKTYTVNDDGIIFGEDCLAYDYSKFNKLYQPQFEEVEEVISIKEKVFQNHVAITTRNGNEGIVVGKKIIDVINGDCIANFDEYDDNLNDWRLCV